MTAHLDVREMRKELRWEVGDLVWDARFDGENISL